MSYGVQSLTAAYPSQDWLTFRQALAAGGCVRKGERGHTIFYADRFTPEDGREGGERRKANPVLFRSSNALSCSTRRSVTVCRSG